MSAIAFERVADIFAYAQLKHDHDYIQEYRSLHRH